MIGKCETESQTDKQTKTVRLDPASRVLDSLTNLHYTICLISSCLDQVSARQFDLTTGSSGVVIREGGVIIQFTVITEGISVYLDTDKLV